MLTYEQLDRLEATPRPCEICVTPDCGEVKCRTLDYYAIVQAAILPELRRLRAENERLGRLETVVRALPFKRIEERWVLHMSNSVYVGNEIDAIGRLLGGGAMSFETWLQTLSGYGDKECDGCPMDGRCKRVEYGDVWGMPCEAAPLMYAIQTTLRQLYDERGGRA